MKAMMMARRAVLLWVVTALMVDVDSFRITGSAAGTDSWKYLSRFAFLPTPSGLDQGYAFGRLDYEFVFKEEDDISIVLYFDSFESWDDVYSTKVRRSREARHAKSHSTKKY
jgi:hypothetical protein